LYNLFGHFSVVIILLTTFLEATSFENFKKDQVEAFISYKDKKDAEFANYLKAEWHEYHSQLSKPLYEKPKPKYMDIVKSEKIISVGPKINVKVKPKVKKKIVFIEIQTKKIEVSKKGINFDFFGKNLSFDVSKSVKKAKYYPLNQTGIASFFSVMAASDYDNLLRSITKIRQEMNLNDWGVYLLLTKLSQALFFNPDEAKLFSWFISNKMGYNVKVGLSHKHIIVMYYSEKVLYSTPSYTFNKQKFYVFSHYAKGKVGRIYTYAQNYPDATKPFDLSLKRLPNLEKNFITKTISFKQYGKNYSSTYRYNRNLINFMATYPQADYSTFFNSPLEDETYNDLVEDLKKYIDGKKASVAMNFVLNFVQNAFKYEVDEEQFGREKVMFAEETLFYDKSDCEDRAILFSYLVKKLFHISVIGVKYRDHMSTALYIPMTGDSVQKGSRKYIIADPTYINANVGLSMKKYKSIRPERFIVVN